MLEDSEIEGLLMWLDAPRYRMFSADVYPADEIRLRQTGT